MLVALDSSCNITSESIGGGRAGEVGDRWGQVGSRRRAKATIRTYTAVPCLQYVT